MISADQKQQIINVLGKQYSPAIISYLEKKEIKPVRAEMFTSKIIQQLMNGDYEHLEAEIAILDLVDQVKKEQRKLELRKAKQLTAK